MKFPSLKPGRAAFLAALALGAPSFAYSQDVELVPEASGPQSKDAGVATYIVRLRESPVVAYDGGIAGLRATRPGKGRKIDPESKDVVDYATYLTNRHNAVLNGNGGGNKVHSYVYSFNGFAAKMTAKQAQKLKASPDVVAVWKDEERRLETNRTASFLGLTADGGLWSQLGGQGKAGENIIIGMVDSGFWPEARSFSDRDANGKLVYQNIPHWKGKCHPAEAFTATHCNQKVIGARHYNAGFGGDAAVKARYPNDFNSPRDGSSHGSHTASTAGGNAGVPASSLGINLGEISGMAPRARLSIYKTCYGDGATSACFTSDSVAAIDQAVADGVDVINYSISGSQTSNVDAVEVAFLFAADAGVFVSASAGNSGQDSQTLAKVSSTVAHNSPWVATVAAGTHDRHYPASLKLGNDATYNGQSVAGGTPKLPTILASAAALPVPASGITPAQWASQVALCFSDNTGGGLVTPPVGPAGPRLDPAKVAGKIVVCDRGTSARVDKSLAVKNAGGLGMILTNVTNGSVDADLHAVPTVHVSHLDRAAIHAYVGGTAPTATLNAGTLSGGFNAPDVAGFSSRGPALASGGDILKPDIMAPGVAILAATSPAEPGTGGASFDFLQGTSMAAPHIAGIAALFKQRHPSWSPAMIKSALMTTASRTKNNPTPMVNLTSPATLSNAFDYGAGQVVPNSAADPGLVYDAGFNDWYGFLCGTGEIAGGACGALAIDPSNLNYPSIASGALLGTQTIKRTVRNVASTSSTYTATLETPPGFTAVLSPTSFTIAPGGTQTYEIAFTRAGAAAGAFSHGAITWNDGTHSVRSPIALRPQTFLAPAQVSGTGGPITYNVSFGYDGPFTAIPRGLGAGTSQPGTVGDDPGDNYVRGGPGTKEFLVKVPKDTGFVRFALFDDEVDGAHDLDLYVYSGTTLVGASGGSTSNEAVTLSIASGAGSPNAIDLTVVVHGFDTATPTAGFQLFTFNVPNVAAGNMTMTAPTAAVANTTPPINLTFSGLAPNTRYLGHVQHWRDPAPALPLASTYVNVRTPKAP